MPPKQCPECGRLLKAAVVEAVRGDDVSCPRCGVTLTEAMFADGLVTETMPVPAGGSPDATADLAADLGTDLAAPEVSVRPPDLEPDAVRDRTPDVLAGWDVGVGADQIAAWRQDRRPFPTDTVVVVGSGAAGLVLGGALGSPHRVRGAALGALVGLAGSAVGRRVWLLRS